MTNKGLLKSLLGSASLLLSAGVVMADNPTFHSIAITCPAAQANALPAGIPSSNVIINFGDYIAGYGVENVLSQNNQVYFRSIDWVANVPSSFVNYYNSAAEYDSTQGLVRCSYQSQLSSEPAISVAYYITNGYGGAVQSQTNNTIAITLPVGLTS